jgi:hypothetical protein
MAMTVTPNNFRQVPIVEVVPTDDGGFTIAIHRYSKDGAGVLSQERFTVGHWYDSDQANTASQSVRGATVDAYWAGHTVAEHEAGVR